MGSSVVVTGANSGIGLLTCLELARHGFDVVGTARDDDRCQVLRDAAAGAGVAVRAVPLRVDDAEDCVRAAGEIAELTGGGPWGLVNNAGFVQSGAVEDVTDDLVRAQLETNVVAPIRLARLFLPAMRARGSGRIVNISSIAGRLATPLMGWYCASKHALEGVTDALRMEVEADGIRVVLVEPGMFGTPIWGAVEKGFPAATTPRYAAAYAHTEALAARSDRLPDPVWVARAVRLALTSRVPVARYLVGVDAMGGVLAETLAPTLLTDWVKNVSTGLRRLPRRRR